MSASFSTLSAVDRCLVSAPKHCTDFHVEYSDCREFVKCTARNFHGMKLLTAVRVSGDCFDVCVEYFQHIWGKLSKGRTIQFTTTEAWLNEWIEIAKG